MTLENIFKSSDITRDQKIRLLKLMKHLHNDGKSNFDHGVKGMKWGHHKPKEIPEHHERHHKSDIEEEGASSSSSTTSGNPVSDGIQKAKLKSASIPHRKVEDNKEFSDLFLEAKGNRNAKDTWRVATDYVGDDEALSDMDKFCTDGGSTVAVKSNGDIVSVCRNLKDKNVRGSDLMSIAVASGGCKLDSYSGNHRFYTRNGMKPVSWCEWCDDFAPDEWVKANGFEPGDDSWKSLSNDQLTVKREPIIFYAYDGEGTSETADDFMARVPGCTGEDGYSQAEEARDEFLKSLKKGDEE